MKRTITALLLALLLLAGCSSSTGNKASDMTESITGSAETPMDNGYYDKGDYNYGWAEDAPATGDNIVTEPIQSGNIPENTKIIYTADVTLETRDFDAAASELAALAASLGGYFESRELNQGGSYRSMYCVIRVSAQQFSAFLSQAGEVAHMTYCNEYSKDVSEAYYDLEARLTTQRTKLNRLQELLAQAKDMGDIITLESAISDTELQIEYLTGSLRKYDSLIDYSTINLSLREVYRLSDEEVAPVTFGDRVAAAFERGMDQCVENAEDFVLFVVQNWLTLIVWGAIIAAVVVAIRRYRKGKTAAAKPAVPADRTDEN